ncbi:MAG: CYTH domain-containing protein [Dehalococcoidia bacterium]|nr:CYTH domain-containing protein [Dehalococcoidia bacterium]
MPQDESASAQQATEEVEWQYTAPSLERVAAWLQERVPAPFRAEPGFPRDLHDTYYDTPGWRLYRAGVACRVRRKGEDAELTLKTMAGAVDDIRTRSELSEALTAGGVNDPAQAPGAAGEAIRATIAGEALNPLFQLRTQRQVYALSDGDGPLGEIALDSTTIDATGAESPLLRVEVEVTDVERARPFVQALVEANGLGSAESSKFQAGLAAAGLVPAPPCPLLAPRVSRPACPPATTPLRHSGATSPPSSPTSPAPASASTPNTSTTCASRPGASAPP